PIYRRVDDASFALSVHAPTNDQIKVPTRGDVASIKVSGDVGIRIEYASDEPKEIGESGLCDGIVSWKTNNPNIFVTISWITNDPGVPDRLLAIVREELGREGLRLLPMHKLDWPAATPAERLSQLIPPDARPSEAPVPRIVAAPPRKSGGVFASPQDVAAAYLQARAKKDLRAYLLCLTPASQGSLFRELLFVMHMSGTVEPARTIEERLKFRLFDSGNHLLPSKELDELFTPPGKPYEGLNEGTDAWVCAYVQKRVGDVSAFLAVCMPDVPEPPLGDGVPVRCEGIRVDGDRASGYVIRRGPTPSLEEVEQHRVSRYLPRCVPIRFRRIDERWLIASTRP
ncbi:hypothetical protein, partial [Aquisphaera insulae]|uniref:hypothetical protein n=1 Tax=Aquisphaera insulae TaxID=2712864 RepID=UPI00196ACB24